MHMKFSGTLLKLGSADPNDGSDNSVRLIQQTLKDKNYLITVVDGLFGTSTELAVRAFQKNNKLQVDGIVGKVTWDALINGYVSTYRAYPGELIGYGSSGDNVVFIQEKLTSLGYNVGIIDGHFGEATKQAIISFQTQHGLGADGIVGQKTWDVLLNGLTSSSTVTPRAYPGEFSMIGSNGEYVVLIQNRLNEIGYNAGTADGFFGETTHNAAVAFQTDHGLDADGVIGESSWNILFNLNVGTYRPFAGVLLGVGSANNEVKLVQEKLNSLGYNLGTADGIFGTGTETAVKNYQQAKGLDVDGIVGRLTWDALFNGTSRADAADDDVAYPGYLIGLGNADSNVTLIQKRLNVLNMGNIIEDGIFGVNTENAVKNFQSQNSLSADGVIGQTTWDKLFQGARTSGSFISGVISSTSNYYNRVLLATGSSGGQVLKLQNKLYEIGYTTVGSPDGIFGENTRNAVISFQHDRGLVEDGIVGNDTWNAIFGTQGTPSVNPNITVKRIFIDAGHGGADPGAVGNGLREKDITLAISLRQKELFEAAGYTVIMSRTDDTYVNLDARTTKANASGVDLLISNHVNAGGGKGAEVWCSLYGDTGRIIADRICNNLSTLFYNRGVKTRQGENGDYLHMIRESQMPTVLIEHGFIDNIDDANKLRYPLNVDVMARATVNAITSIYTPESTEDENVVDTITTGIAAGFKEYYHDVNLFSPNIPVAIIPLKYGEIEITATIITDEQNRLEIAIEEDVNWMEAVTDAITDEISSAALDGLQVKDVINEVLAKKFNFERLSFTGLGDLTGFEFNEALNKLKVEVIGIEFIADIPNTEYKLKEAVKYNIEIDFDDLSRLLQESIQQVADMKWALISVAAVAIILYATFHAIPLTVVTTTVAKIYTVLNGLKLAGVGL